MGLGGVGVSPGANVVAADVGSLADLIMQARGLIIDRVLANVGRRRLPVGCC